MSAPGKLFATRFADEPPGRDDEYRYHIDDVGDDSDEPGSGEVRKDDAMYASEAGKTEILRHRIEVAAVKTDERIRCCDVEHSHVLFDSDQQAPRLSSRCRATTYPSSMLRSTLRTASRPPSFGDCWQCGYDGVWTRRGEFFFSTVMAKASFRINPRQYATVLLSIAFLSTDAIRSEVVIIAASLFS